MAENKSLDFAKLLDDAMTMEGRISEAFRAFHNYSFGNQLLAMLQIGAEPINTYPGWQRLGRQVKRGSRAIELVMPVTCKDKSNTDEDGKPAVFTRFIFRRNWFGISQTEGDSYQPEPVPGFDRDRVLRALDIPLMPFEMVNGNVQGYANAEGIALNPIAKHPTKTLFHELGHKLLGHIGNDSGSLTRSMAEVEAESVAYLLCNVFDYTEGLEESRGYIQNWKDTEAIPAANAKRIIQTVGKILDANKPQLA